MSNLSPGNVPGTLCSSIIAEYDGTGALNAEYVHGDVIDEILTMERGGNTYYYFYDGLGSVTEITDSTGTVVENYTYDVYGTPSVTISAIGNPFRFTGQEYDEESGLHHFNSRTYNDELGRFQQRDSIGYIDSMNLMQYVHNNPTNFTDPTGEAWWIPIIEGALLAYDTYELVRTETDPCASDLEKNVVRAAWLVGATSFGGGTTLAARRAAQEAAERAARSSAWKLGGNKSAQKWANQLSKRGWTSKQIDEAITQGQTFKAKNYVNPNNTATRYVHPKTGQSVVIDDISKEVIHVGGPGFKY